MAFRVPFRRLGDQFSRAAASGLWVPVAQALDRNFAEIETRLDAIAADVDDLQTDPTFAFAYRSSATTSSLGADILIVLNAQVVDDGNNFDTSTGLYTAPTAGVYEVNARTSVTTVAGERFLVSLRHNGTSVLRGDDDAASGANLSLSLSTHYQVAAGATLGFGIHQVSGAASRSLEVGSAPFLTWATFRRVSF